MEPKEDDITKQWTTASLSGSWKRYIAGIDTANGLDASAIVTEYVDDETLYAVKEQIAWAGTMLKNKKWRKHLDNDELEVLQKIYKDGNYLESEKSMLNNILKKYNE